nr:hypothetical protein [Deltaproteobacteria bacterium]
MKIVVVRLFLVSIIVISPMFTEKSFAKINPKTVVGMWLFDGSQGDVAKDSSQNGVDGKIIGNPKL